MAAMTLRVCLVLEPVSAHKRRRVLARACALQCLAGGSSVFSRLRSCRSPRTDGEKQPRYTPPERKGHEATLAVRDRVFNRVQSITLSALPRPSRSRN